MNGRMATKVPSSRPHTSKHSKTQKILNIESETNCPVSIFKIGQFIRIHAYTKNLVLYHHWLMLGKAAKMQDRAHAVCLKPIISCFKCIRIDYRYCCTLHGIKKIPS